VSKGNKSTALGGLVFATLVGALGVAAGAWFGMSYHYGQVRHEVAERVLATADWSPERVEREGLTDDCSAANLREEAERLMGNVDVFEVSKVDRFGSSPTAQRARELSRTLRALEPATKAFLAAYACNGIGRFARTGREQQLSGPLLAKAIGAASWIDDERSADLMKVVWVGRDTQASAGLYEFMEGARIMAAAYGTLARRLEEGALDPMLDPLMADLEKLIAHEESAQNHWRAGSRVLLADLLGPEWDANPPTPLHARAMIESMDDILASLDNMPKLASAPYPERYATMETWIAEHDMSAWDQKFQGFGDAGLKADALATHAHALGRALYLGAALRKYRRSRGYCPRELDDLVDAKVVPAVPRDPVAAAPFTYDRRACSLTSAADPTGIEPIVVHAIPR
jgi:hypothetical protein